MPASANSKTGDNKDQGDDAKATTVATLMQKEETHALLRDPSVGMNPVTLTTGLYDAHNKRVRHTVQEGALHLPAMAFDLFRRHPDAKTDTKEKDIAFALPDLEEVVRPSRNPSRPTYTVTHVRQEETTKEVVSPEDGSVASQVMARYVAERRVIAVPNYIGEPERIRGGGEPEAMDVDKPEKSQESAMTSSQPDAGPTKTEKPTPSGTAPTANSNPTAPEDTTIAPTSAASSATSGSDITKPVASSAPPAVVASSSASTVQRPQAPSPSESTKDAPKVEVPVPATKAAMPESVKPKVVPLPSVPTAQWELQKPATVEEPPIVPDTTILPEWYKADKISDMEEAMLPEWFDGSASHRTRESYMHARETVRTMAAALGHNRYLTATVMRRTIAGDAGSLLRLHEFLTVHALINYDAMNESMPTPRIVRAVPTLAVKDASTTKTETLKRSLPRDALVQAVVEHSRKKPKTAEMNWDQVASTVGLGATAEECQGQFLALPLDNSDARVEMEDPTMSETQGDRSITPDVSGQSVKVEHETFSNFDLEGLVESTDPAVIDSVMKAAMQSTDDISEAQRAARIGLAAHASAKEARSKNDAVARIMSEVLHLKMKLLENRMELLDDAEGIQEAERVALELERRDLYTARCRHWFGGT